MLQVSSSSVRDQTRHVSTAPLRSGSTLESRQSQPWLDPGDDRTWYVLFAQHKSGSMMALQAATLLQRAVENVWWRPSVLLHKLVHKWKPKIGVEFSHTMGNALFEEEMVHNTSKVCMLHFARNPFEMVASGYVYHMAQSETWLNTTFSEVEKKFPPERFPQSCGPGVQWECLAYRGIKTVFKTSRPGSAWSHVLPEALSNETYPEYLRRVDVPSGLLAESIWASNFSMASLPFTASFVQKQSCSQTVCYSDFFSSCNATWERILRTWNIEEPYYSSMLQEVARSCPTTSLAAKVHSGVDNAERRNLTHPPKSEIMKHLRKLDKEVLGGVLANLEKRIGCPLSDKYADSTEG